MRTVAVGSGAPRIRTHRQLTPEQQTKAGAAPNVVRVLIGIEDPRDIMADLEQALATV